MKEGLTIYEIDLSKLHETLATIRIDLHLGDQRAALSKINMLINEIESANGVDQENNNVQ